MTGEGGASEDRPIRCAILPGIAPLAEEFAAATGLTVAQASELVDDHIVRGADR